MCRLSWAGLVLVAIGCGGPPSASIDGAAPPPIDGGVGQADRPSAADPTCAVRAADPGDLCGGAAGCVQRRSLALRCSESFGKPNFVLVGDGRALIALATEGLGRAAFLLEVSPAGEAKVWPLGPAERALVAAAADGAPVVLLWSKEAGARLARRAGDSFGSEPVALPGVPRALALGAAGVPLVLTIDARGTTQLTRLDGGTSTAALISATWPSSLRLFVDAAGAPTVAYTTSAGAERVYSRWTAGVTTEIRRVALAGEDDTAAALLPDGSLRLARTDRGSLLLFGDGAPERAVFAAKPWTTPTCTGFMVAYYPALCPQAVEGDDDVGEQATARHALVASPAGALFSAVYTAHVRVGCSWQSPSCIETMPCDCSFQPYQRLDAPFFFRIRPLDGTAGGWILREPQSSGVPGYAVDGAGAHHLLWHSSWELTLATFELRR